ncbi:MAG TPA: glycosyltransferase [Methylomusa anaerophila]|uniref:Glucosyl-3-phosphoglycerate synthase n=1 Tax=Methylomusa anaerophila TaxID=1930071 RepID=A0A348AHT3_9FIRM|nr:glycosyltransferase [Methylomusa anaerophila]BBB90631.1 glucosyl-3-phosphoglycerate synthase [Methylomusa anaerophila]HML88762.1 glycosyltransferase [Methylomusa anaerophila]
MPGDLREQWPVGKLGEEESRIHIKAIQDIDNYEEHPDDIIAITDGWRQGPVAAVLRGGINANAVLTVLAQADVPELKIFHLEEKIADLEDVFISTVVGPAHAMFDSVSINWRREHSVYDLIKNIGKDYSMLFFGAPLAHSELLPFYQNLKENFDGGITIVRGPIADIDFDESDEIFKWVRDRTFEADAFSLPALLRSYKKKLSVKVAVVLPSLNEEKTVGNVIRTVLEVKKTGVIDEVILVDSMSTDQTVAIARSFDIPVYIHQEIEPDRGSYRGKGEAMFKSAFITDADIIAWVDTDVENIAPHFFYGLLGPILAFPDIRFTKGYFSRPVRVEASGVELGGGRVTEILARPWINTFLPILSGYIQPLAGTVAIYRDLLLKMRIPVNYGVEIAMLAQAVTLGGLWSTCQVNLGEVVHKSKDVIGLSEMAFQILQILVDMEQIPNAGNKDVLRRVYSAHGNFEIGIKRFTTVWRQY